jgi:ADP-ribosyl-[dinitrogen reductase] hydrolase
MRLAPVSIAFRHNIEETLYYSACSSRTTHNGDEAKECCRLLSWILVRLFERKEGSDPK